MRLGLGLGLASPAGASGPAAPTLLSATVSPDGASLVLVWSEAVTKATPYINFFMAVEGGAESVGNSFPTLTDGDGTDTLTFDASSSLGSIVQAGDTCLLTAAAGEFVSVSGSLPSAEIANADVTNDSEVAPILMVSATLLSATRVAVAFDGAVTLDGTPAFNIGNGYNVASASEGAGASTINLNCATSQVMSTGQFVTAHSRDPAIRNGQGAYVQSGSVMIDPTA